MTTALLLIDIQNDYFENGSNVLFGSLDAAKNARRMLDEFRRKQWPVVHIQHLSTRATATFFFRIPLEQKSTLKFSHWNQKWSSQNIHPTVSGIPICWIIFVL